MKIILKGNVFNPTGIATVNREICKAFLRLGHQVQTNDIWHDSYEFNKGLEILNNPINSNSDDVITIFADYPEHWRDGYGKLVGHFVHEGTRLWPHWINHLNKIDRIWVPSKATKNLFKWNDVQSHIEVIPHGVSNLYKPKEFKKETDDFIFLSVNSWTGQKGDRKGTDILIKAFDEEFKKDEKVKLLLKISTFWRKGINYGKAIYDILGHTNPNILWNDAYVPEKELVTYYQKSDCFVSPTRGEAFGLTIINAMACGLPVIVTHDVNSGHMDYTKGKKSVLFIDAPEMSQSDPDFYCEGNLQPIPDKESLKEQMRKAFEEHEKLKEKAKIVSNEIRKKYTWENTAKSIIKLAEKSENEILKDSFLW